VDCKGGFSRLCFGIHVEIGKCWKAEKLPKFFRENLDTQLWLAIATRDCYLMKGGSSPDTGDEIIGR
jgi:hypothetical protein